MSGDAFRKVRSGEKLVIPARAYNAFLDAAQAHMASEHSQGGAAVADSVPPGEIVLIRNDTGEDITERHGIVTLGEPLVLPDENESGYRSPVAFSGILPESGKPFAVLLAPVKTGELAKAMLGGVIAGVRITGSGDHAGVNADGAAHADKTGMLAAGDSGPVKILYAETGTEARLATIQFPFRMASAPAPASKVPEYAFDNLGYYWVSDGQLFGFVRKPGEMYSDMSLVSSAMRGRATFVTETGDTDNQLSGYENISDVTPDSLDASGLMHISIADDGGGSYHIDIYSDAARSVLIGSTASYSTPGDKSITSSGGTGGVGGTITVDAVVGATSGISAEWRLDGALGVASCDTSLTEFDFDGQSALWWDRTDLYQMWPKYKYMANSMYQPERYGDFGLPASRLHAPFDTSTIVKAQVCVGVFPWTNTVWPQPGTNFYSVVGVLLKNGDLWGCAISWSTIDGTPFSTNWKKAHTGVSNFHLAEVVGQGTSPNTDFNYGNVLAAAVMTDGSIQFTGANNANVPPFPPSGPWVLDSWESPGEYAASVATFVDVRLVGPSMFALTDDNKIWYSGSAGPLFPFVPAPTLASGEYKSIHSHSVWSSNGSYTPKNAVFAVIDTENTMTWAISGNDAWPAPTYGSCENISSVHFSFLLRSSSYMSRNLWHVLPVSTGGHQAFSVLRNIT